MFPYTDNASANPALRAQFEAQVGYLSTLSQRSCDLLARVSELNMQLARQSTEDMLEAGRQMAACTDPMQLGSLALHGWQPLGEHLRSYGQNLVNVLTDAQSGLGQAVAQAPGSIFGAAQKANGGAGRRAN